MELKQSLTEMGVYFSKRYKTKNKNNFINYLVNKLKEKKIEYKIFGGSGHHLCVGNLETAAIVVLAYYDTADLMLLKNYRYTPLDAKNVAKKERLNSLIYAMISISLIALIVILTLKIKTTNFFIRVLVYLFDIILGFLAAKMAKGVEKKINMNANSAAIAVLYKIMMSKKLKKTALILVDNAAMLTSGYRDIKMIEEIQNKKIIILNNIGYGTDLVICANPSTFELAKNFQDHLKSAKLIKMTQEEYERTVVGMFENSLMVFSAEMQEDMVYIENTRNKNDFKVNVERLENIEKALIETLI